MLRSEQAPEEANGGEGVTSRAQEDRRKGNPGDRRPSLRVHVRAGIRVTVTLSGLYVGRQHVSACEPRREHDPSEAGSRQLLGEQDETKRHHPRHQNVSGSEVKEITLSWPCFLPW